jgi:hypothetical protein
MGWYKITLTAAQIVADRHLLLLHQFMDHYVANGCPRTWAMLSHPSDDLTSETYFFTPGVGDCPEVLAILDARPAEPPPREAQMCGGHQDAFSRFREGTLEGCVPGK